MELPLTGTSISRDTEITQSPVSSIYRVYKKGNPTLACYIVYYILSLYIYGFHTNKDQAFTI
jgi:hypothetical protein